MRNLFTTLFCIFLSALISCTKIQNKKDESVSTLSEVNTFDGETAWASSYIVFDVDKCAFLFESSLTNTEFTLKQFKMDCYKKGVSGIYAPAKFSLIEINEASPSDQIAAKAPVGSKLIIRNRNSSQSSGWYNPTTQSIFMDLTYDSSNLINKLSFSAVIEDSQLKLSQIKMHDGYSVSQKIALQTNTFEIDKLRAKTIFDSMKIPANAQISTNSANRNFLYCKEIVNVKPMTSLIDFKGTRYKIYPEKTIGEIGVISSTNENEVLMAATQNGSYSLPNEYPTYNLGLRLVGGRDTYASLELFDNYAILKFQSSDILICQFLQNDVFRGYYGWNP